MTTAQGAASRLPQRVLVVDDDPFTRDVVKRRLERLGIPAVLTAGSVEEARVCLATTARMDLIFCDLGMPDEDGVTLLRGLAPDYADCGIVLISAISEKLLRVVGNLVSAHGLWLLGTLSKPLSTRDFDQVMTAWRQGPGPVASRPQAELSVNRLRTAIRDGEIQVHVQPQCALDTGALVGVEALSRWTLPGYGPVFPDLFIPFATTHGLINALTEHVLNQVLDALAAWREQGLQLTASINIAASTLHRVDLPDVVLDACARRGINPNQLVFELTEADVVHDLTRSLDVASRLYLAGVTLALDDYGTGQATLSQLRQFPFGEIKLDRSFVASMRGDAEARTIVESSCRLARSLDLRCVAEGIEDDETLRLVRALECDLAQGYLIARPMPISELLDWSRQHQAHPVFGATNPSTC